MAEPLATWTLKGFVERLDAWAALENPTPELRRHVTAWVFTRYEQPYRGVRREPGFPDLWFGAVPNAVDDQDRVVVCAYYIREAEHAVICESFATLSQPV